ncbi:MAG TPA: NADAR family protein [Phototrophicaceae bacterium]|nr:NADAR family protein [Phototrophicaceae bacterium]
MSKYTIPFYSTQGEYGCFSNFSRHGFELDGKYWKTSEHYFQAQKFAGTPYEEQVRLAPTPKQAAELGRRRDFPLRADWETVKEDIMRRAVQRKFETHADLKAILLSTGDQEIVENAPGDYYWGCGKNGTGKNRLGHILMTVRARLREAQSSEGLPNPLF